MAEESVWPSLATISSRATQIVAVAGLASGIWYATTYLGIRFVMLKEMTEQMGPLVSRIERAEMLSLQVRWSQLNWRKRKRNDLSWLELQEYCLISKQLKYVGIPECGI